MIYPVIGYIADTLKSVLRSISTNYYYGFTKYFYWDSKMSFYLNGVLTDMNKTSQEECTEDKHIVIHFDRYDYDVSGNYSGDYLSGIITATLMFGGTITVNGQVLTELRVHQRNMPSTPMSGYVSAVNRTTADALACSEIGCDYRKITPDDGTTAYWIFSKNFLNQPLWNLIMTDDEKEFIKGLTIICEWVQTLHPDEHIILSDYVLGPSIGSEGNVGPMMGQ